MDLRSWQLQGLKNHMYENLILVSQTFNPFFLQSLTNIHFLPKCLVRSIQILWAKSKQCIYLWFFFHWCYPMFSMFANNHPLFIIIKRNWISNLGHITNKTWWLIFIFQECVMIKRIDMIKNCVHTCSNPINVIVICRYVHFIILSCNWYYDYLYNLRKI